MRSSFAISTLLHAALVLPLAWLIMRTPYSKSYVQIIQTEWTQPEQTTTEVQKVAPKQMQEITQKKTFKSAADAKPVERIFGLDKDSLKADGPGAVSVKEGNTITKEQDDKKLVDTTALPVPKPEFLVTQMPVLLTKPEIPYPAEARKNEIEGKVLMTVLIDEQGKVRKADLISGPGYGLNELAMTKIYEFLFKPAKIGGDNVAVQIRYAITFQFRS